MVLVGPVRRGSGGGFPEGPLASQVLSKRALLSHISGADMEECSIQSASFSSWEPLDGIEREAFVQNLLDLL